MRNPKRGRDTAPSKGKVPKSAYQPVSRQTVKWCFKIYDKDMRWHSDSHPDDTFYKVAERLKHYSGMTWGRIEQDRKRDHAVYISKLTKKARRRLAELKMDSFNELWRFRFEGVERIWGVRDGDTFQVLWWDPRHDVCPSK